MTATATVEHSAAEAWARDNQRHLVLAASAAAAHLDGRPADGEDLASAAGRLAAQVLEHTGAPVALDRVTTLLGLTGFERALLVATAAPAMGLPRCTGSVTFVRGLSALPDPHWSAVLPDAPLRAWRLVEAPPGSDAVVAPLSADERVLHALAGADTVDDRLAGRARVATSGCALTARQLEQARAAAALVAPSPLAGAAAVLDEDRLTRRSVAVHAGAELGLTALVLGTGEIPADPVALDLLARLLAREAGLGGRLVVVEVDEPPPGHPDSVPPTVAARLAESTAAYGAPVLVSADTTPTADLPAVRLPAASVGERAQLFAGALAAVGRATDPALAEQHPLTPAGVAAAVDRAVRTARTGAPLDVSAAARSLRDRPLHGLAELVHPSTRLEDLVLPEAAERALRALLAHVRQRGVVHGEWGYAQRSRGLAVTALLTGPSGTGKTTAAHALAGELGLDVLATDLSQVVSKYVGETEKNLARLFDAAQQAGAVLVFDEGDALFGKRTEVRDSRDRYANLEVSFLLQRLETFEGIAVITTNAREALDPAFTRRMRFVVPFPFPDAVQRARLWQAAFPPAVPTEDLRTEQLAQLSVTGGTIAQLALAAAFLAAEEGSPVRMAHVLAAARVECDKLDRPLSPQEVRGWVP